MAETIHQAYDVAEQRVDASKALKPYRDIILETDWTEGAEHYAWVASAPEAEILDWASQIREAEEAERGANMSLSS